jgi:hypothetical protein
VGGRTREKEVSGAYASATEFMQSGLLRSRSPTTVPIPIHDSRSNVASSHSDSFGKDPSEHQVGE